MGQEGFDVACLRAVATDADAQRIALASAMIKMLALRIARDAPAMRGEAMAIVGHVGELYRALPTRQSIGAVIDEKAGRLAGTPAGSRTGGWRDDLVETLWRHFHSGRKTRPQ